MTAIADKLNMDEIVSRQACEIDRLKVENRDLMEALFMCASHCQGGHGAAGMAASKALGISFPVSMMSLERRARQAGFDPRDLWPWLAEMRGEKPKAETPG